MGKTEKLIADIFISAKEKGLKNVSIRIDEDLNCVLYVGKKDRSGGNTLKSLLLSLSDHKNLSWMNE